MLVHCPDCGNKVSSEAECCKNCGRPIAIIKSELIINETEKNKKKQKSQVKIKFFCWNILNCIPVMGGIAFVIYILSDSHVGEIYPFGLFVLLTVFLLGLIATGVAFNWQNKVIAKQQNDMGTKQSQRFLPLHNIPVAELTPFECYLLSLQKIFCLSGRACRREYWWAILFHSVFFCIIYIVFQILVADSRAITSPGVIAFLEVLWSVFIGMFVFSLEVRRLQDCDISGDIVTFFWFAKVLFHLLLFCSFTTPIVISIAFTIGKVVFGLFGLGLFWIFVRKGDVTKNKYGTPRI